MQENRRRRTRFPREGERERESTRYLAVLPGAKLSYKDSLEGPKFS